MKGDILCEQMDLESSKYESLTFPERRVVDVYSTAVGSVPGAKSDFQAPNASPDSICSYHSIEKHTWEPGLKIISLKLSVMFTI